MSDNLRNKMLHFQAEPPASAWDAIASSLDGENASYPKKLYQYQQQPGKEVWDKIAGQLNAGEKSEAKVIPLKGFSKSFKYAAAAAVIAALAWGVFYLANTNNTTPIAQQPAATNSVNTNNTTNSNKQQTIEKPAEPMMPADENRKQSSPLASNDERAYKTVDNNSVAQKAGTKTSIEIPLHTTAADMSQIQPQSKTIINEEAADRYMIATTDDGAVRLPKKAYSDFACAVAANANMACKEKVEMLQNKMATSMTTDFAQFLDLLKNLQ